MIEITLSELAKLMAYSSTPSSEEADNELRKVVYEVLDRNGVTLQQFAMVGLEALMSND